MCRGTDDTAYHPVDTLAVRLSEQLAQLLRDILGAEYAGTASVVYVMIYVCNTVGKAHNASFKRIRHTVRMTENSVPHLLRQVKRFEQIDHAQALTVMAEAAVIAFFAALALPHDRTVYDRDRVRAR